MGFRWQVQRRLYTEDVGMFYIKGFVIQKGLHITLNEVQIVPAPFSPVYQVRASKEFQKICSNIFCEPFLKAKGLRNIRHCLNSVAFHKSASVKTA